MPLKDLYFRIGFNGTYSKANFRENATVNDKQVNGYLEEGALENSSFMLNVTYSPNKKSFQHCAKLGFVYFITKVKLGDVPLSQTDNEVKELFQTTNPMVKAFCQN
jgi:hypothetical protein